MQGFPETWKLFQGFLQGKKIEKGWIKVSHNSFLFCVWWFYSLKIADCLFVVIFLYFMNIWYIIFQ
jgi:hypothetical protein